MLMAASLADAIFVMSLTRIHHPSPTFAFQPLSLRQPIYPSFCGPLARLFLLKYQFEYITQNP